MKPLIDRAEIIEPTEVEDASAGTKADLPDIENAAKLLADEKIALPPEIIEGVLHQGLKAVIGGSSKTYKSWIVLDVAISVATGSPFWRWPTHKGRVLYINFEIPRAFIRSRIQQLCKRKNVSDLSDLDIWTLRGHAAALSELLPRLLAKISSGKYLLIIIDPIYKALGDRDENSATDISGLCNELERLAVEKGAAVLYAAHFSKGIQAGREAIDRIGGSGVWTRDADTIITLTKHETEGAFTVDLILRNLPEQQPFVVEWNFPVMTVSLDLDPSHLKQRAGKKREHDLGELLSYIAETTIEKPVSISAWARSAGIVRQTLGDYLEEMRLKGWIATVNEGSLARQYITEKGRAFLSN